MGQRYGLEIRAAGAADGPGLATLLTDLTGDRGDSHALAARLEALSKAGGTALIAIEWGPPSGIVALQAVHDLASAKPAGFIATLGVASDARRRGIGRLLVKAAARSARLSGCDRLVLAADAGRPDLFAFAAATGFLAEGGLLVRPLLRRGPSGE